MKTCCCFILFYLIYFYSLSAQTNIVGNEKYSSFKPYIYIDNLDQRLIPEIFKDIYYSKLKKLDFKIDSQVVDTLLQTRTLFVNSRKIKDGYCFINEQIMNRIKVSNCNLSKLSISYVYNGKIISTRDEICKLIKLRKDDVKSLTIRIDEENEIGFIYLTTE